MWKYEHSVETTAPAEAVWALYADVNGWTAWDTGMERIEILGPFAVGTEIEMTPEGQEPVRMRITALEENALFADETVVDGLTVRFVHRLDRVGAGTRVTHRVEVTGPGAEHAGPEIASDLPEAMAALVKLAER
ncbi:SRPBCC family protein [Nonomuraea sp. NPDC000554]|uniref:SRPBCC family protein n=1 Tax=Nonomuraea sp. NPDC000554 TaxID=3154259 RepID=UPI00332F3FA9